MVGVKEIGYIFLDQFLLLAGWVETVTLYYDFHVMSVVGMEGEIVCFTKIGKLIQENYVPAIEFGCSGWNEKTKYFSGHLCFDVHDRIFVY